MTETDVSARKVVEYIFVSGYKTWEQYLGLFPDTQETRRAIRSRDLALLPPGPGGTDEPGALSTKQHHLQRQDHQSLQTSHSLITSNF